VASFVAVGLAASLTLVLVLLPTLESSFKSDRVNREGQRVSNVLSDHQAAVSKALGTGRLGAELDDLFSAVGGGQVRVSAFGQEESAGVSVLPPDVLNALTGLGTVATRTGSALRQNLPTPSGPVILAAVPLYSENQVFPAGALEAAVPVRAQGGEVGVVRRRVLLAVAAVLGLASLVGLGLAWLFGRRIARVAGTAEKLAGGDLSARSPQPGPRELASLGASLNAMAARLERQLAATVSERDRANGLIASLAEGVIAVSPNGTVSVANEAAQRALDLPGGGAPIRIEALPAALADAARAVLLDPDGPGVVREVELGPAVYVLQVSAMPELGAGAVLTMRDVTDERRLERVRRDLVANVSHELKTPLTALRGFIELMEDPRLDPERRAEFVELMGQEAERLQRLVEEQLELARLDAGGLPLEREALDLGELAESVAASRRALAARDGVDLRAEVAAGPAVRVLADPARIEQLILILLDNALRHTPPGGSVAIRVTPDGHEGTVAVCDTGTGIPIEAQRFVFDRFYQADSAREGRGAGLGLAIARGLARAHGGTIDLRSSPGRGSTFTVRLPRAAEPVAAPAPARPA
jgi:signal transduction histidine kinase